jgi:hypothetical protein
MRKGKRGAVKTYKKTFELICMDAGRTFGMNGPIILNPDKSKRINCSVSLLDHKLLANRGDRFKVIIEKMEEP